MLVFVAKLAVDPGLFAEYARRGETRREHALELQRHLGLRTFRLADWRACLRVGVDAAWATDRGEPIAFAMERAVQHLRDQGALLPNDLLAHVAPLGWEHIALTGDYVWTTPSGGAEFRPLRDVRSTFQARVA